MSVNREKLTREVAKTVLAYVRSASGVTNYIHGGIKPLERVLTQN